MTRSIFPIRTGALDIVSQFLFCQIDTLPFFGSKSLFVISDYKFPNPSLHGRLLGWEFSPNPTELVFKFMFFIM